ncbi:cobalamin B12-binding domain-containing protein [Sphingomonas sp. M1-B02]|uniref:cobalamin B12-binding domain-containing protein n=1 Tax=Sphingomonas sp. M1-B02 TaxID=3114300 RepID=UPI00223FA0CD|nr:cobalamin B12-binding domain-containing protein [Sphingomonas sp. S6-11]UZK66651.1 cobalamin B12-binding domain-containing protein [Sphingomonas sp. S6-11]
MPSLMRSARGVPTDDGGMLTRNWRRSDDSLSAFRSRVDLDDSRSLTTLIESEIIPRLMVAHATDLEPPAAEIEESGVTIDPAEVEALAPMALQVEADVLLAHVERILSRGVSVDTVMVDLLAPAARLLGEYWEDDRCDFIDVTMGLWRLQEIVHEIATPASPKRIGAGGSSSALFASMPGDGHSFGTVVIEEVFRRDGWETDRLSDATTPDLLKRVSAGWFDLIGLTISCDCHIAELPSLIAAMRNVSRNPRACVMVGGRVFAANPDLARQIGADGTARDAKVALKMATSLVRERAREAAHYR